MIKVKVTWGSENTSSKVVIAGEYPCIKMTEGPDCKIVVLFTAPNNGVCIHSTYKDLKEGYLSSAWPENFYKKVEGPLNLVMSSDSCMDYVIHDNIGEQMNEEESQSHIQGLAFGPIKPREGELQIAILRHKIAFGDYPKDSNGKYIR